MRPTRSLSSHRQLLGLVDPLAPVGDFGGLGALLFCPPQDYYDYNMKL